MVRRYEQMDEDAYDDYARYQQATGPPKMQRGGRYEVPRASLKNQQSNRRARFVMVYINGEKYKYDNPSRVPFSRKKFPQMDCFLDEIAKITKTPVRHLFKWPSGEEIIDIGEVEDDDPNVVFVCSDNKRLYKRGRYGGMEYGSSGGAGGTAFTEKYSRNSHNSRATTRSQKQSPTLRSGPNRAPVNITVISNTNRHSRQSLFIDPQTKQPFEDILANVTEMLEMDNPPCVALYSVKPPYKKVDSISSFNRIVPVSGDTFWACGGEGEPVERRNKSRDTSPMRNGNNQSPRQRHTGRQNGYQERNNPNRQTNGNARQTNGYYEDSQGRGYQRHQERGPGDDDVSQEEDEQNNSPQRREPIGRQKPSPQQNKQKTPRRSDDDDRKKGNQRRGRNDADDEPPRNGQRSEDDDDDNRRYGRGNNDDDEDDDKRRRRKDDDDSDDEDKRGRPDSTTSTEMADRIAKIQKENTDLDKDIDY